MKFTTYIKVTGLLKVMTLNGVKNWSFALSIEEGFLDVTQVVTDVDEIYKCLPLADSWEGERDVTLTVEVMGEVLPYRCGTLTDPPEGGDCEDASVSVLINGKAVDITNCLSEVQYEQVLEAVSVTWWDENHGEIL